ncbi:MAG: nucleotidyltransferase family protein [Streptosporangiaceae bacterium]
MADEEARPLRALVESRREQVRAVALRHRARRVRLFGSVARGEEGPGSDIDLLVDFDTDSSLFDLMRMTRELEELLGHPVDIVSAGGLKDRDREILTDSIDL